MKVITQYKFIKQSNKFCLLHNLCVYKIFKQISKSHCEDQSQFTQTLKHITYISLKGTTLP
jgi:hypothetical protein